MITTDYHIHTSFSSDSDAPMEKMVLSAIEKGLKEIAFTDHVDFDDRYALIDYNQYIITFNKLKEKYSDKIKLIYGVEVGLGENVTEKVNNFTKQFPFDFIIGSSHAVKGYDLYLDQKEFFGDKTKKEAYTIYFEETLKNVNITDDFCVYGHIDFVNRYGLYDDNSLSYLDYSDYIDEILKSIIEKGKGIEINTSGYRYNLNQTHPSFDFIKRYKQLGGEVITVGSDAHYTKDIAANFDVAYDMLDKAGFKYITLYKNLKPIFFNYK